MYIITATFDPDAAFARASEMLALGDSPERLAERLGVKRDLAMVRAGVQQDSFRRLLADLKQIRKYLEIQAQIEDLRAGKTMMRFLGEGFKERQISKLEEDATKFDTLIDAPTWFYQQPRVQLLSAIRDYALDGSQQGDAAWTEAELDNTYFPICAMFESANQDFAQELVKLLEKPLKDVDVRFLLEKFEGNRSITFDFDKGVALYYAPAPSH